MSIQRLDPFSIPAKQQAIRDKSVHPTGQWVEFPRDALDQSVAARFETIVEQYHNHLAVKDAEKELTYSDLNQAANYVAHAILETLNQQNEPVVLLMDQGYKAIIGITGIIKTGCAYVPLDPNQPRSRLNLLVRDSQTKFIITDEIHFELARQLADDTITLVNLDSLSSHLSRSNPDIQITPQHLAYIYYTSGSTGKPKGVSETQKNLLHHILRITNTMHICSDDRHTLIRSHCFAGTLKDIFGALLNGGSVHLLNLKENDSKRLAQWLVENKITLFWSVVSTYRNLALTLTQKNMFPDLRLISSGGMSITPSDIHLFQRHFSAQCLFISAFALTETGILTTFFFDQHSDIHSTIVPVGYPMADIEILLLDDYHQPVAAGQIGEIAVKSQYLSPCYWRMPALNQAKFLSDTETSDYICLTGDLGRQRNDGSFVYVGRRDSQVKVRGFRVELNAVEAALQNLPEVRDAIVIGRSQDIDGDQVIAYLVTQKQSSLTISRLRQVLAQTLPSYMIPEHFVFLDALPLNANLKIDHSALPEPDLARPALDTVYVPPHTQLEKTLVQIWVDVFELDKIGIHDNFFELGGHSLKATKIVSRIQDRFQIEFSLTRFFQTPTIAGLGAQLEAILWLVLPNEELTDDSEEGEL